LKLPLLLTVALAGTLVPTVACAQDRSYPGYRYYYDQRPYTYPSEPTYSRRYYDRRPDNDPRDSDYDSRYVKPLPRRDPAPEPLAQRRRPRAPVEEAPQAAAVPPLNMPEVNMPGPALELTTIPEVRKAPPQPPPKPKSTTVSSPMLDLPLAPPPEPKTASIAPPATKAIKAVPPSPKVTRVPAPAPKVAAVPLRAPKAAATMRARGSKLPPVASLRADRYTLPARELFGFDEYALRGRQAKLDEIARMLKSYPEISEVRITGYTDKLGTDSYNLKLSQRRADAVRDYLVERGVPASRLKSVGRGNSEPVVHCGDDGGEWDQKALDLCLEPNRRIEIESISVERPAPAS
jgi:outer membrane protein OmpA-like peptidoglycan-associated protein